MDPSLEPRRWAEAREGLQEAERNDLSHLRPGIMQRVLPLVGIYTGVDPSMEKIIDA
jgi:hypothetical protein